MMPESENAVNKVYFMMMPLGIVRHRTVLSAQAQSEGWWFPAGRRHIVS